MNLAIQSIIDMNLQANDRLDEALIGRHHVRVNQESPTYVMNEDGEFSCRHDSVIVEPPCCSASGASGYIDCGCGGMRTVYCPDCMNEDLTDHDIETILGD